MTCGIFGGTTINAGDTLTLELDGVTNPSTQSTGNTVSVSTTSDNSSATQSTNTYAITNAQSVSNVSVTNVPAAPTPGGTTATNAPTVYLTTFKTSTTGGMSGSAGSKITIVFPSGTGFGQLTNAGAVRDGTTLVGGNCSESSTTVTCGIFGGTTINAGDTLTLELDGVTNPSTQSTGNTVSVSTTSDNSSATQSTNTYAITNAQSVSNASVTLSNSAAGATGITYKTTFTTSSTGGMSGSAGSKITIVFPSGTGFGQLTNAGAVRDGTTLVGGNCSESSTTVTCGIFGGTTINAGHTLTLELDGVTNPSAQSTTDTAAVSTSSDRGTVNSSPYTIGSGPPPPTVTGVSPSSGTTAGGTTVTISGTNLTGATAVHFGPSAATNVAVNGAGTQITATSPPGTGTVDVTVTTAGGGTSQTGAADRFTYVAPPPPPPPSSPPAVAGGAPTTATGTGATLSGTVNPESQATTTFFEYGIDPSFRGPGASTTLYDQSTPAQQLPANSAAQTVSASLTGLVPGALYHVRLVATNGAGTTFGPDQTFTTAKAAAPPPPVLGHSENAQPVSGTVFIRLASGQFVKLTGAQQIPSGAVVDALHGTLKITTALPGGGAHDAAAKGKKPKPKAKTQSGDFGGAIFKVTQAGNGLTSLSLVEGAFNGAPSYALCQAHKSTDATIASSKTLQLLKASAHGKFRTKGRYAAATVRGTVWTEADRCDGTLTHDITDSVAVTDLVRHKTIILHAGQSYLAKARK